MSWRNLGNDPDYRFSLANERTFLAWIRTALAILAGSIVLHQLASHIGSELPITTLSFFLALLAGVMGAASYFRWRSNELAMRLGRSLSQSWMLTCLALVMTGLGSFFALWLITKQL